MYGIRPVAPLAMVLAISLAALSTLPRQPARGRDLSAAEGQVAPVWKKARAAEPAVLHAACAARCPASSELKLLFSSGDMDAAGQDVSPHRDKKLRCCAQGTDHITATSYPHCDVSYRDVGASVMRKSSLSCVMVLGICGCSIHPIPFDAPGYRTIDIVKKIRCETKRALDKFAQDDQFKRKLFDAMSIGYKFTFTITENNKFGLGAGFKDPLSKGTFTLGIAGGAEAQRLGERDFTIVDTFKEARGEKVCTIEATGENYAYPITGIIGLEEVIRTFFELQGLGLGDLPAVAFKLPPRPDTRKLSKKKQERAPEGKTAEFVETFEFTTTIRASASPKIELKPAGSGFALADASASLSADRTDKHALVITLAPNYTAALATLYSQNINSKLRRIENAVRLAPLQ